MLSSIKLTQSTLEQGRDSSRCLSYQASFFPSNQLLTKIDSLIGSKFQCSTIPCHNILGAQGWIRVYVWTRSSMYLLKYSCFVVQKCFCFCAEVRRMFDASKLKSHFLVSNYLFLDIIFVKKISIVDTVFFNTSSYLQ